MTKPARAPAAAHAHLPLVAVLAAAFVLPACIIPVPIAMPSGGSTAPPTAARLDIAELERQVLDGVNAHRTRLGLPPLRLDAGASAAARQHSQSMADHRAPFGHHGFEQRSANLAQQLPYRSIAENVAWNDHPEARSAQVAVDGWIQSAGHRRNIEGEYEVTGIGVARSTGGALYYTQIFVLPR